MTPYYQDDSVTIYHGDARDVCDMAAPSSVDALITDPPYGMAFVSGWTATKASVKSDGVRQGIRVARQAIAAASTVLHPDAHLLVFCHWESWPDFYDALSGSCAIRNAVIWHKGGGGMGDLRHEYAKDYEVILFGAMSRGREIANDAGKRQGAVLSGPSRVHASARVHPTEKPVDLLVGLVGRHAPAGGLVLDPFMGGGSTLVAAKSTGRKAIGIEVDERYCEIAAKRMEQGVLDLGGAA